MRQTLASFRWFLLFMPIFSLAQAPDTSKPKEVQVDEDLINLGMADFKSEPRGNRGIRVGCYNVENLFDIYNDSLTLDDEFTPEGDKGWSLSRYKKKLANIYKVMMAMGGWGGPPEVMGFCEIENRAVLEDLISKTPLLKYQYAVVHENSTDRRGVDVGFIYQKSKFRYLSHQAIRLTLPDDPGFRTRDILYIQGIALGKDTLHVFVNHWPSRRGGQAASEPKRMLAAAVTRAKADSILALHPNAKIVLMGDFNDHAEDRSMTEGLRCQEHKEALQPTDFYNFMVELAKNWKLGSHKYQGHWGTLDHIVASAPLLLDTRKGKLRAAADGAHIFAARFLMEEDKRYLGLQPFRTYSGPRFIDGFSDHLPIYIDLWLND